MAPGERQRAPCTGSQSLGLAWSAHRPADTSAQIEKAVIPVGVLDNGGAEFGNSRLDMYSVRSGHGGFIARERAFANWGWPAPGD